MTKTNPRSKGFYMPAEWEPHEGTGLQWPQDMVYQGYELKLERIWFNMVEALHDHENVHLIVSSERQRDHVVSQLQYHGIGLRNVDSYFIPTNDVWARDNGPIFVINDQGEIVITDWIFNGWGERFPYDLDNKVPSAIGAKLDLPVFQAPMVLEAGTVEVNGKGTFMATTESGKPLTLVPLPLLEVHQTSKMTDWRKNSFTNAAYSNYLIANKVVLVTVYGHANDEIRLEIIAEHFPSREIIGIDVVALIEHGGAIGSVTQLQPLPVKK